MNEHSTANGGRILILQWDIPIRAEAATPTQVASRASSRGARFVLLDATQALYADSDALRWLLQLQSQLNRANIALRIAAWPESRVWRNLVLLRAGLDLHESVRAAWKRPWPTLGQARRGDPGDGRQRQLAHRRSPTRGRGASGEDGGPTPT